MDLQRSLQSLEAQIAVIEAERAAREVELHGLVGSERARQGNRTKARNDMILSRGAGMAAARPNRRGGNQ
jgi:hypothetical protein